MHFQPSLFAFCAGMISIINMGLMISSVCAHPGGLDASGGHTNRKTGEYHQHIRRNTALEKPKRVKEPPEKHVDKPMKSDSGGRVKPKRPSQHKVSVAIPDPLDGVTDPVSDDETLPTQSASASEIAMTLEARIERLATQIELFAEMTGQSLITPDKSQQTEDASKLLKRKRYQSPLKRLISLEKKIQSLEDWQVAGSAKISSLEAILSSLKPAALKSPQTPETQTPESDGMSHREKLLRIISEQDIKIQRLENQLAQQKLKGGQVAAVSGKEESVPIVVDPFQEVDRPSVGNQTSNVSEHKNKVAELSQKVEPNEEMIAKIMLEEIRALLPRAAQSDSK